MQVPFPQHMLWQQVVPPSKQVIKPSEQYIATVPPQGIILQHPPPTEGLVRIPLLVNDGWVVQGIPQEPQPAYIPQPLQYVTFQPQVGLSGGAHVALEGSHLNMREIKESLPPRPVLVPGRPSAGICCNSSGRTLRGNPVAVRRPSEEYNIVTPIKKPSIRDDVISYEAQLPNENPSIKSRDAAILEIAEYYFSDESLSKNAYLLKQVSQQGNGFVSLKCIAALKRIKTLTRDDCVVAQCIRRSRKLELSEDGTMVRRIAPLPINMESPRFIRSVIAINLPMTNPTIEAVTSLFVSYGDLTQVRVLKPGKKLPTYLKVYQAWIPDLGENYCALVEFEKQDEAQRACREINMRNRASDSLRVALLKPGARLRRTLYRKYKGNDESPSQHESFSNFCTGNSSSTFEQSREYDASGSGSGSESDMTFCRKKLSFKNDNKCTESDSGFALSSGDEQNALNDGLKRKANLMQRQKQATKNLQNSSLECDTTGIAARRGRMPINIIRHPIGPKEGEKGFNIENRRLLNL